MIRKLLVSSVILLCSLVALLLACAEPLLRLGARHALADTGLVLEQLQGLHLQPDRVSLQQLRLRLPSGQHLDLASLTLQPRFHGWQRWPSLATVSIARAALQAADPAAPVPATSAPLQLGELLALPGQMPALALDIDQLQLPWWPAPLQLTLRRSTDLQLALTAGRLQLSVTLMPPDTAPDTRLEAQLQQAGRELATLQASLNPGQTGLILHAEGQLSLTEPATLWQDLQLPTPAPVLPVLALGWSLDGRLPDDAAGLSAGTGNLALQLDLRQGSRLTLPATWPGGIGPADLSLRADSRLHLGGTVGRPQLQGTLPLRYAGSTHAPAAVIDGSLALHAGLPHGALTATLSLPALPFSDSTPLSAYLPAWPWPGDLVAGALALDLSLSRPAPVAGEAAAPLMLGIRADLQDLSGHYGTLLFRGLQGELRADLPASEPLLASTPPLQLRLAALDPGIPLRNLQLALQYDGQRQQLRVDEASAELFGGQLSTRDAVYEFSRALNSATVHFDGLQLADMLSLANYGTVEATGAISGQVPLTLGPDGLEVQGGSLQADSPGGNIRYADAAAAGLAGTAELELVNQVLENFVYDNLSSSIDYSPEGKLQLQLQLHGYSPALGKDQPVHLNLNLVDDIPALLQSLQAARNIESFLQEQYQP